MEGKRKPDYKTCIEISSKGAIGEMKIPSMLAIVVPVVCGFILGPEFVGGILIGSTICSIMIAIFTGNAAAHGTMGRNTLSPERLRVREKESLPTMRLWSEIRWETR